MELVLEQTQQGTSHEVSTTNLKNDIMNFQQKFDETFSEAWDRFKDLCKCPHHGFSKLHQINTFYNPLAQSGQDSLNSTANGNLLNRTPRDALTIIENKSKELVLMNKANQQASMKSIEETCVTCGGPHPYYECIATDSNTFNASAATKTYNQACNGYRPQGDSNYHARNQIRPPECAKQSKLQSVLLRDVAVYYHFAISTFPVKIVIRSPAFILKCLLQLPIRMMSSPDHSTSNNEDAFSSNILDYVSSIPDYFPASSKKTYSNASNNSTGKIPSKFSPFYNMKDIQAFYAKELPIPSPNPITPPVILTPSPVLPPSLLFDPQYFFVHKELLPPKKQIHPLSSSSNTLSKLSWKQIYTYEPSSSLVHTPTLPPLYEPGK
nr:reverse transcriptase domain-containing protein [Tanacetum cinerariifolium]